MSIKQTIKMNGLDSKKDRTTLEDFTLWWYFNVTWELRHLWQRSMFGRMYYYIRSYLRGYDKIPTFPKLEVGRWYDTDTKIERAIGGLLRDYISPEGEDGLRFFSWEGKEKEKEMILDAYHWFSVVKPSLIARSEDILEAAYSDVNDDILFGCKEDKETGLKRWIPMEERLDEEQLEKHNRLSEEYNDLEKRIYDETTEHLCNIIKIRNYLWT